MKINLYKKSICTKIHNFCFFVLKYQIVNENEICYDEIQINLSNSSKIGASFVKYFEGKL
ncbi:hypothetical protein BpHYR1_022970 [Brachionus plicatilis]|uniref:Uncharacterized protein n=1 Tax=Brachionus plicatilis TaxID=10195 RepID=A0A3M7RA69_BRAPC|nr:hypothetical protein BpHYR1_022970 [Brachionus plicatilis]